MPGRSDWFYRLLVAGMNIAKKIFKRKNLDHESTAKLVSQRVPFEVNYFYVQYHMRVLVR